MYEVTIVGLSPKPWLITSWALASYFKNMLLGLSPFIKSHQLGFNLHYTTTLFMSTNPCTVILYADESLISIAMILRNTVRLYLFLHSHHHPLRQPLCPEQCHLCRCTLLDLRIYHNLSFSDFDIRWFVVVLTRGVSCYACLSVSADRFSARPLTHAQ